MGGVLGFNDIHGSISVYFLHLYYFMLVYFLHLYYFVFMFRVHTYIIIPSGAYEWKEYISHIDTMAISKNKVILADSHAS